MLVAIPVIGIFWWCGVRLGIALLHPLRPGVRDGAVGFGGGPETLAGITLLFSPAIAAVATALWVGNAVVYAIPQARRAQAIKEHAGGIGYKEAQAGLVMGMMLGLAAYVALLATSILLV